MKSKKQVCVATQLKWEEEACGLNTDSQLLKISLHTSAPEKFICSPNNPGLLNLISPYPLPSQVTQSLFTSLIFKAVLPFSSGLDLLSAKTGTPLISPEGLCQGEESQEIKFSANFGRVLRKEGDGWRVIKLPLIS